jgi:hypothetical protein
MSERELIKAFQEGVAAHSRPAALRRLSADLISRDRWRVRILAGLASLLWLAGIIGILYMVFWFNRFITLYGPLHPTDQDPTESWRAGAEFHAKMELHHSLEACMVAVPLLLLAALCTVWLVFSSRRATLNQINLSLTEISEQLRELRLPARPPEGE